MVRTRSMCCGTCLMVFVLLCGTAGAQEWTRFRGPDGTGRGQGESIPVSFTEADYLWKVKLPGPGASSPVLWGDRVFLTCTHDARKQREIVCVNGRIYVVTRSGEVIVLKAGPEFRVLARSPLPEKSDATPAIANGRMYVRTLKHLICIGGSKAEH